ncbi:esyt3 [Acrasis kona]|uniref:Esyt3 n=1 Tax=Acrasis kona TaxID=1008807 RepID=A0AAW2ZJ94_9EUKA
MGTNPYVTMKVGSQKVNSKSIKGSTTPEWNQSFAFKVTDPDYEILQINMCSKSLGLKSYLGYASLPLSQVPTNQAQTLLIPLTGVKSGSVTMTLSIVNAAAPSGLYSGPSMTSPLPSAPPMNTDIVQL